MLTFSGVQLVFAQWFASIKLFELNFCLYLIFIKIFELGNNLQNHFKK